MISDIFAAFVATLLLFVASDLGLMFLALGLIAIVFGIVYRAMCTDCEVL